MLAKHAKLMMVVCLLLGLSLGVWIGIAVKTLQVGNSAGGQRAVRVVKIKIDLTQREALFTQLQKFADKWGYATRIAPLDPNGENFSVQLWRADMNVSGLYPNDPGTLDIGFFYTDPAVPVPERYFDEEIDDLRNFINEIPGATLSVDK